MEADGFSPQDADAIFGLAERLTGNSVRGKLALANVARRLEVTGCESLFEYLRFVETRAEELPYLISALLVHTTSFFREEPHFAHFQEFLEATRGRFTTRKPLRFLSAACSTGEEVYSFGLVLERFRRKNPGFDYVLEGRDIDQLCLAKCRQAVYPRSESARIPEEYRALVLEGSGKSDGLFTVDEQIRRRCRFQAWNLVKLGRDALQEPPFDFIACRNVLIYFAPEVVERVVGAMFRLLAKDGLLCLGHSESLESSRYGLVPRGNSIYEAGTAAAAQGPGPAMARRKKVLVVDDSASVRRIIARLIESAPELEAVTAASADEATRVLSEQTVELITLDLNMPEKDGLTWLKERRAMGLGTPVVIISDDYPSQAAATLGALENGAQDYFHKGNVVSNREEILGRLRGLMEGTEAGGGALAVSDQAIGRQALRRPELILIGASIGGPEALGRLLGSFPPDAPPVLVVQHISENFSRAFARHLSGLSGLRLVKPAEGLRLERGCLYMADGDFHLGARHAAGGYEAVVSSAGPIKGHRPSVDFLFRSVAEPSSGRYGCERVFAAILTGMGADGAEGLLALRKAGAMTFAQERSSCVVFGMPREAIRLGAAGGTGTILDIRRQLEAALLAPAEASAGLARVEG
ncbi:MAG: response regulator [Oligoflexia bacterium]|nr:response regulator [Oligoflexia bacterium]